MAAPAPLANTSKKHDPVKKCCLTPTYTFDRSHGAPRPLRMRCRAVHSRMLNGRRAILLLRVVILRGPTP